MKAVFVKLMPSIIDGVGVFAIRNIKMGDIPLVVNSDNWVLLTKEQVEAMPPVERRLAKHYSLRLADGSRIVPRDLNQPGTEAYLNHSDYPNVTYDDEYNFIAICDIDVGEELFIDYEYIAEREYEYAKKYRERIT
jgi:hypothetical protein